VVGDPSVTGEAAESPQQVVQGWYEAEGGKDSPFIPSDWPQAYWSCLVDLYPDLRVWVAHQPYAPEAVIRSLADDADWRVRHRLAMKRNLPADLFSVMGQTESRSFEWQSPATPRRLSSSSLSSRLTRREMSLASPRTV
jgi:hypothetical protein